jgi:ATP-dependent protease ClpP protease subunit
MPNWRDVLEEHQQIQRTSQFAIDIIRRKYLKQLYDYTNRNVIAYYSGFLSKPGILQSDINDEDKNGFMMAVHKLDRNRGLDLILHTPGGSIAATESIVDYLHKMFGSDIRAVVPQIAMSAGTMMACSCNTIVMSKHSNLGPIDPHLGGMPAYGVIEEFKRACREVKRDSSRIPIWQPIISQYSPTFLSQCENAIKWSNAFVERQLETVMFSGQGNAKPKAKRIVKTLTDYKGNKTHERHIHFDECHAMGLNVTALEDDPPLQDLVLTVHHCFMHALMNTDSFKMIENHEGAAFVKHQKLMAIPQR